MVATVGKPAHPLKILLLGGGSFVGRAVVTALLAGGHEPTIFSRGRTGAELFPQVPRLIGDRDTGDYAALKDGRWDAVVDTSGYVPREVGQAMDALGDRVGRYLFVSSHAVYRLEDVAAGSEETVPLRPPVREPGQLTDDTYGPAKVACEQDIRARFGERASIVRPGKVAGPHDNQDGLAYWVRAAAGGGRVEIPGDPAQPVQLIDVRDLAALIVRLLVDDRGGAFTAVGESTTITSLVETCAKVAGTTVEIASGAAGQAPLLQPERPWSARQRSNAKAVAAGMPVTPLAVTVADVLAEWG
jgi:2'-hydroxyisoflavone reductase